MGLPDYLVMFSELPRASMTLLALAFILPFTSMALNESFVELSAEKLKKGRLLIKTELQRQDDKPVNLDYLMHQKDGQWKIISVIANGVNDLSLKRAEYATVIKDNGFDGLVAEVGRKISEMEKPKAD